jgi:Ricin-type beta-trefoil lectin domain-like
MPFARNRLASPLLALVAMASLLVLIVFSAAPNRVSASAPTGVNATNLTSIAAAPNGGFWVQVDGGHNNDQNGGSRTIAIDGAPQFDSVPQRGSIAAIPGRAGYWVVTGDGAIYPRGNAPELCSGQLSTCSDFPSDPDASEIIVGAAGTPDGKGLWAVARNGKLWTAGSAQSFGDTTNDINIPTAIAGTPSGQGYYIVLADGGVYSFGDAVFYGSTGGKKPGGHDATGLALSFDTQGKVNGYWMVFDDGGVFTFGQAPFLGSSGGNDGGSIVTGIAARANRFGYAWVHATGGIEISRYPNVVIASAEFGTVLGPIFGGTEPSAPLGAFPANGSASQQWHFRPTTEPIVSGSVVQFVNVRNGLCADITGADPTGSTVIQFPCKSSAQNPFNQLWTIDNQNGVTQFIAYGQPAGQNSNYTLAADADGTLSLVPAGTDNPGWIVSAVP